VIPVVGQVALHDGVAVKGSVPLGDRMGAVGLINTETMVTGGGLTVITVKASFVDPLSVALT
jgi:hypothetical protein